MAISKFEERKTLTWGDFLLEEVKPNLKNLTKVEKNYLEQFIEKGNDYQEQLNEEWLEYGFMTYEQYMKQINKYICLQDNIMHDIRIFIKNCKEYN